MATSSFFIDIDITNKKTARKFLEAIEKAEKKEKKKINVKYKNIDDIKAIKKMF